MKGKSKYRIFRLREWGDVYKLARELQSIGFIFRGQSNSEWWLESTFDRKAQEYSLYSEARKYAEEMMIRNFKRYAHNFLKSIPEERHSLNWLALMRHYGAATRLVDFTKSFYVAAFFAIEEATKDGAIWALSKDAINYGAKEAGILKMRIGEIFNEEYIMETNACVAGKARAPMVIYVEPELLYERIYAQQGLFVFPCSIEAGFEQNVCETMKITHRTLRRTQEEGYSRVKVHDAIEAGARIIKFVLPREYHSDGIADLESMNINYSTLFPGLDGLARSLNSILRWHDDPRFRRMIKRAQKMQKQQSIKPKRIID